FLFRFGSQLDPEFRTFQAGDAPLARDAWTEWLKIDARKGAAAIKDPAERDARERFLRQLSGSTSVGESVLGLYKRKSTSLLQGIIVISDGRSNQGSAQAFPELRRAARDAHVPIFTV